MRKLYYLTALILAIPFIASAQSNYKQGYVVTSTGDTLKGYIDYREWDVNPDAISFKKAREDKSSTKYGPSDIKTFAINGSESYIQYSGPISTDPVDASAGARDTSFRVAAVFLKVLEKGDRLALYSYRDDLKIRYYISEGPNYFPTELILRIYNNPNYNPNVSATESKLVTEKTYKRQVALLAQKYNELTDNLTMYIQRSEYNEDDLLKIASTINHMSKTEYAKSHYTGAAFALFAGAGANFNTTTPSPDGAFYKAGARPYTSVLPVIYFGINFFVNPATRRLQFLLEMSATQIQLRESYMSQSLPYVPTTATYNASVFSASGQVIFNFYNGQNFKIFGGAGLIASSYSFSNNYIGAKDHNNPAIDLNASEPYLFNKFNDTFLFKAGIQFTQHLEIFAEYQTEINPSIGPYFELSSTSKQVGLIYLFR